MNVGAVYEEIFMDGRSQLCMVLRRVEDGSDMWLMLSLTHEQDLGTFPVDVACFSFTELSSTP